MKRWPVVAGVALMLGGCAVQPKPAPQVMVNATPEVAATPAPSTGAQLLAAERPEVQAAVKQHAAGGKWPSYHSPADVLYPFDVGAQPVVDCAALRTTDLQLQPGETVTDLAIGDQERWMATPAASGDPQNPVPHIALKPQAAGIETNLTVYTTRHIYHLSLRSRGRAMQEVEFYYPDELLAAMHAADAAAKAPQTGATDAASDAEVVKADPSQLNFAYTIDGPNVAFKPVRAFDDGTHVYLEMPPSMKSKAAPALLIGAAGGTQMVNYRVRGSYFVVDRLFDQGVLLAGVGREQDRVVIAYAGGNR
jgi:P-type conjugative transfer protein TrbG